MSSNRDEPKPLAIRGCREPVKAVKDINQWVEETSGRRNDDSERTFREVRYLNEKWQRIKGRQDAVLFVERKGPNQLDVTVFTEARIEFENF